jgi:hypothetical protein
VTSIYQGALGDDFQRLHPKMQHRFAISSAMGVAQIGHGVMDRVWRGPWWTVPFLLLGSTRNLLFPSSGTDVPFTVSNYAYVDGFGRETVTWSRRFAMRRGVRAFDATMVASPKPRTVIDYLGTHQHLAVDIECSVDEEGAMCLRSGEQRFHEGRISFRFPLLFSGTATVRESWDEELGRFRISVRVANRFLGPLFGYEGSFDVTEVPCTAEQIPHEVIPLREEARL